MSTVDSPKVKAVLDGVLAQDRGSVARCLRFVDDYPELGWDIAFHLFDKRKGAKVIGITGNPGAGKSTVVDALIHHLRGLNLSVAVLAVDPSSPFSGGAILGDRIRMNQHIGDDGVFIRSFATRGTLGGLSRATFDSVRVLDAAGFDVVLVETVGVGQDEIDIARLADTTVVVMVPGLGDDIQAIKAGILEVADIFLLNKADREGVSDLERSLKVLMSLSPKSKDWEPPILKSIAVRGEGLDRLWTSVEKHRDFLCGEAGQSRARAQAKEMYDRLVNAYLIQSGRRAFAQDILDAQNRIANEGCDPYALVHTLMSLQKAQ